MSSTKVQYHPSLFYTCVFLLSYPYLLIYFFPQGTEEINDEGAIETKVTTTDYRTSAGETEPKPEKVGVVHLSHGDISKPKGGILTGVADTVVKTVESTKDSNQTDVKDKSK